MKTNMWAVPAIVVLLLVMTGAALAEDPPAHPDLSGNWVLNRQASGNIEQILGPIAAGPAPQEVGGRGSQDGPQEMTEERKAQILRRMERMLERLAALEIFHEDPDLDYTDGLEISRVLHTDGREDTVWTETGQMQASATWTGGTLEITWVGETVSRKTYLAMSPDGRQLIVNEQVRSEGRGPAATLRLVYNRAEEIAE